MGEPTRIKICGTTNLEDATFAVELGAWALGMIFYDGSPRSCSEDDALAIAGALRREVELAGVFVNATLDDVAVTADRIGLSLLQLHGDEGPAFCAEAARRTGCRVIKATRVRSRADLQAIEAFHTDFHLLDAHRRGLRGGTGETFDWEMARDHRGAAPAILSGGLRAENVAEGIAIVRPYAVDVASGVEERPGRKDEARLRAFFEAVHGTDREPVA
ncbi:MAG TPA: phosphoribosylanthranilate isomerase [Solirubrobacteraceae bacterium]